MTLISLALPLWLGAAQAADTEQPEAPATDADAPPAAEAALETLDTSEAEALGRLTPNKIQFLKPKRSRLPQNPYGSTDFTAYSLEFGEWRMGLAGVTVGIAPRVQLGTVPVLDALGVYNATAKANFLRLGPLDLAAGGSYYTIPTNDFIGSWTAATGTMSLRIVQPWSLHVSGSYVDLKAKGSPLSGDLSSRILTEAAGDQLSQLDGAPVEAQEQAQAALDQAAAAVDIRGRAVTVKVATDIRLNRRDSIVLQGSAMMWGELESDVGTNLPPILGLDEALDQDREETLPIEETYIASAAWQMQWKRLSLRVGAGVSSVPGAWLLQTTDLAWHFGGKTRASERRMRQAWRQDRRSLRRGTGDALAAAMPPPPTAE